MTRCRVSRELRERPSLSHFTAVNFWYQSGFVQNKPVFFGFVDFGKKKKALHILGFLLFILPT